MKYRVQPTDRERSLGDEDFIVSKTDLKGRILYGNRIFIDISGYDEAELLGSQHNIIRHPDMPRGVFRLLWDTIQKGQECNAYVKNMSKDGGFYWVFANVMPDFDADGHIIGYTSVRRKPRNDAVRFISGVYKEMLRIEREAGPRDAPSASLAYLDGILADQRVGYAQFVFNLQVPSNP
ncbi:MAG: PAS domain-containing protein [Thiobacillaceae bacterium]